MNGIAMSAMINLYIHCVLLLSYIWHAFWLLTEHFIYAYFLPSSTLFHSFSALSLFTHSFAVENNHIEIDVSRVAVTCLRPLDNLSVTGNRTYTHIHYFWYSLANSIEHWLHFIYEIAYGYWNGFFGSVFQTAVDKIGAIFPLITNRIQHGDDDGLRYQ